MLAETHLNISKTETHDSLFANSPKSGQPLKKRQC
uniref:Uncharacterized protein n=1 Tax=Anguilla anguilla TaxID=7936 RepID=A0A0E9VZW6_ANGAN